MDIPEASSTAVPPEPEYTPSQREVICKAISEQIKQGHPTCIVNLESQLDPDLVLELERKGYTVVYIYQYTTVNRVVSNRVMITNPNLSGSQSGSDRIENYLRFSGVDTQGLNIGEFFSRYFR